MAKKKKDKRTNNDLQDITNKTKDRVTRTSLRPEDELMCAPEGQAVHDSLVAPAVLLQLQSR